MYFTILGVVWSCNRSSKSNYADADLFFLKLYSHIQRENSSEYSYTTSGSSRHTLLFI